MYKLEKTLREDRYKHDNKNPSFSSTLLDEIYRSIDDGDTKCHDKKLYRETMQKKQHNNKSNNAKSNKTKEEEEEVSSFRRACFIEKWMDKKVSEKANMQKKQSRTEMERKSSHHHHRDHDYHDHDQDALFSSSTSSSSDSSSGGFSSSDTDSMVPDQSPHVSCHRCLSR